MIEKISWPFLASFSLLLPFQQLTVHTFSVKKLSKTGCESRTSVVGSDRSANWTTTTAQDHQNFASLFASIFYDLDTSSYYVPCRLLHGLICFKCMSVLSILHVLLSAIHSSNQRQTKYEEPPKDLRAFSIPIVCTIVISKNRLFKWLKQTQMTWVSFITIFALSFLLSLFMCLSACPSFSLSLYFCLYLSFCVLFFLSLCLSNSVFFSLLASLSLFSLLIINATYMLSHTCQQHPFLVP